jgi:hypothetical protein
MKHPFFATKKVADGEWVGFDDVDTVCAKLRFAQSHGGREVAGIGRDWQGWVRGRWKIHRQVGRETRGNWWDLMGYKYEDVDFTMKRDDREHQTLGIYH